MRYASLQISIWEVCYETWKRHTSVRSLQTGYRNGVRKGPQNADVDHFVVAAQSVSENFYRQRIIVSEGDGATDLTAGARPQSRRQFLRFREHSR